MERIVNRTPEPVVSPVSWAWEDHRGPDERDDDPGMEVDRHRPAPYRTHPSRPGAQLIARVALWGAVAFGCVGGCVGLVRPPADPIPVAAPEPPGSTSPAPVAGAAERVVSAWLSATDEEQADLGDLFVDEVRPVAAGARSSIVGRHDDRRSGGLGRLLVGDRRREVTEIPARTQRRATTTATRVAAHDDGAETVTTWYVEVGIVGDVESGLAALTTPACCLAPAAPRGGGRDDAGSAAGRPGRAVGHVDGFLRALLAGDGDPARYMAPGRSTARRPAAVRRARHQS